MDSVTELPQAPDWLVGLWRREAIELQDGTSDRMTRVFWGQTLNLFVDIRIPMDRPSRTGCLGFEDFTIEELTQLSEQHAFAGHVLVEDETCTWRGTSCTRKAARIRSSQWITTRFTTETSVERKDALRYAWRAVAAIFLANGLPMTRF